MVEIFDLLACNDSQGATFADMVRKSSFSLLRVNMYVCMYVCMTMFALVSGKLQARSHCYHDAVGCERILAV